MSNLLKTEANLAIGGVDTTERRPRQKLLHERVKPARRDLIWDRFLRRPLLRLPEAAAAPAAEPCPTGARCRVIIAGELAGGFMVSLQKRCQALCSLAPAQAAQLAAPVLAI